ncbi:MAG TPA: hypothetical protein VIK28_10055 [Sedimentisphaerales bacterium]
MKQTFLILANICLLTIISGCVAPPPREPQTTTISCRVPTITPLPETKPSQEKGGLEITIVPANYKAARQDKHVVTPTEPNLGEALLAPPKKTRATMTFVQEEFIPQLKPQPNRLEFAVRINNKLSRVFRGQGSVVQINVAGKLMPINRADYAEFVDGIVPPRNETELKIYGPAVDSIPEKGTIGIFLYDVVTATDTAGNVTEKQNYEWYFNYETQLAQESAETRVKRGWVENSTLLRTQMQNQQGR